MAVDPPLVAPGFGADGFEDALVLDGEAWGKGLFGLFAAAIWGDEDVIFGVLGGVWRVSLIFHFPCVHHIACSAYVSGSRRKKPKIALMMGKRVS